MAIAARAAQSGESAVEGIGRPQSVRPGPDPVVAACGIAPATGVALPSLRGVDGRLQLRGGDREVLRCTRALMLASVATADDWVRSKKNPLKFIERTLQRWISEGYGDLPRVNSLDAMLLHDLVAAFSRGDEESEHPNLFYIVVFAGAYVPVHLGNTIRLLDRVDPRFPVTFHELLLRAMYSVTWAYSWHSIENDGCVELAVGFLLDAEDSKLDVDALSFEEMDARVKQMVPASLHRKPYSLRTLRDRLCRIQDPTALRLFTDLLALLDATRGLQRDNEKVMDQLYDMDVMPPWPGFYLGIDAGDTLDGVYDQYCWERSQAGEDAAPSYVVRFDITDLDSVRRAHDLVVQACRVLGMTKRLIDSLPTVADPAALVNVLVTV